MTITPDPPLSQVADERDELDWDRAVHGRMADAATADDAVKTEPWAGGQL